MEIESVAYHGPIHYRGGVHRADEVSKEAIWLKGLLTEMGLTQVAIECSVTARVHFY